LSAVDSGTDFGEPDSRDAVGWVQYRTASSDFRVCIRLRYCEAARAGYSKLVDRFEAGDVLVVAKLDGLGRIAMDVRATVEELAGMGVASIVSR